MTPHEILQHLPRETACEAVARIETIDRPAYRALLSTAAERRKLRPVFLERKSRPERHDWVVETVSRPANADLAEHLLQLWLLGDYKEMICRYLDLVDVSHDGKGFLETVPAQPPPETIDAALEALLEEYPAPVVAAYLRMFEAIDETDWPHLSQRLESDERLRFDAVESNP